MSNIKHNRKRSSGLSLLGLIDLLVMIVFVGLLPAIQIPFLKETEKHSLKISSCWGGRNEVQSGSGWYPITVWVMSCTTVHKVFNS